jgi:hypothetical protein
MPSPEYSGYAPPPPPSTGYGTNQSSYQPAPGTYTPSYDPYTGAQPKKKSATPFIIIGVVVVLILALCGGTFALANSFLKTTSSTITGGNTTTDDNSSGDTKATSQSLDLKVVYASVEMTFTSLQQANKFSDDSLTGLSYKKKNYIRLNFKEQQTAKRSGYFSYREAFHLILPDKSVISPLKPQEYSSPDQGVSRTNWIDFETNAPVDLTQLTLRLGESDEQQMEFPLKTGADTSKYQPKKVTPNTKFRYATMNWTLKSATQSYYYNGQQAKTGKIYITVELQADNPGENRVYLYNFLRLQSGDTTVAPDYSSDLNDFSSVKPQTTNLQGSATFLIPPSEKYTLQFLASSSGSFDKQAVDFEIK